MSRILNFKLKVPTDSEIIEGLKAFLNAFGSTDLSRLETIGPFCTAIRKNNIAHFIAAETENQVIGLGSIFYYTSLAWIGFMGIEPVFQRKGVGNEILSYLLNYAQEKNIGSIRLDATEAGKKLYLKYGFKEEHPVSIYELNKAENKDNPLDRVKLEVVDNLPDWVLKLDKEAFGGDRRAFLGFLLSRGKIILAENRGYGIVFQNRIGPVIAESVDIAIEIVKYAYHIGARRICIPHHATLPNELFSQLNLKKQTQCTRMLLGEKCKEDINKLYASYSFASG